MKIIIFFLPFLLVMQSSAQMPTMMPTTNNSSSGKSSLGGMGGTLGGGPAPAEYLEILTILKETPGYPALDLGGPVSSIYGSDDADEPQLIESYDSGIRGVIDKIPNSQLRAGLEKYLEIINAKSYESDDDVGGSNQGLAQYHQQTLSDNPCFASLAENFYAEISKISAEIPDDHPLDGRPTLAEEAGVGRFDHLEPGWLMEKALEATNGNADLAMEMIGLCGHDDVAQTGGGAMGFSYSSMLPAEEPNLDLVNEALDYEIKNFEADIKSLSESQMPELLAQRQEHLEKLKEFKSGVNNGTIDIAQNAKRNIPCPRNNSPFYVAKSLGEEVDLSEEQKRRIEVIQAPTKGRGYLPSKNYHFMGSAYMACKLVQEGVSPGTATLVQKTAAWAYRTIRLNTQLSEDLEVIGELDELYEAFVEEFHKNHYEMVDSRGGKRRKQITPPSFDVWMHKQIVAQNERYQLRLSSQSPTYATMETEESALADLDERIPVIENFPSIRGLPRVDLTIQDIADWRVKYDAAKILDSLSVGGGSLFGLDIPHTNLGLVISFLNDPITRKVTMADLENDPNRTTPIKPRRSRGYPHNWSRDRYTKAHDKALTYLIDWEWTTNQHEVGANFGSQQCTRQEPDAKADDQACLILGESPEVLCNLKQLDEEGPAKPVKGMVEFVGKVSDLMTKEYLDPGIESKNSDGVMTIKGAF